MSPRHNISSTLIYCCVLVHYSSRKFKQYLCLKINVWAANNANDSTLFCDRFKSLIMINIFRNREGRGTILFHEEVILYDELDIDSMKMLNGGNRWTECFYFQQGSSFTKKNFKHSILKSISKYWFLGTTGSVLVQCTFTYKYNRNT